MEIEIYTDGSCTKSGSKGGWAAIFVARNQKLFLQKYICGYDSQTTSNRMEVVPIINVLQKISQFPFNYNNITIYSDSKYAINTCSGWVDNWVRTGRLDSMKNPDLWNDFIKIREFCPINLIKYQWIKGHAGHKYNEMADYYAGQARIKQLNIKVLTSC